MQDFNLIRSLYSKLIGTDLIALSRRFAIQCLAICVPLLICRVSANGITKTGSTRGITPDNEALLTCIGYEKGRDS